MATKDNMMNKEINKEMIKFVKPLISLSIENDLEKGFPTSNRKVQGDIPPTLWCCCCWDVVDVVLIINCIVTALFVFISSMLMLGPMLSVLPGVELILALIQICAVISPYICGIYGAVTYTLWGVIVATIMHSLVGSLVIQFCVPFDDDGHGLTAFLLIIIGFILSPHIILIKGLIKGMRNITTSDPETSRQHDWKTSKLINTKRVTKEKKEHTKTNKNASLQRKKIISTNICAQHVKIM